MKYNACIYLISLFPIFNKDEVSSFETFDVENSIDLYSALTLTNVENIESFKDLSKIVYCFDEKDKEYLPEIFKDENRIIFFEDSSDTKKYFRRLAEKHFSSCNSNLLIFSNSIGVTKKDIEKSLDQLAIEDEAIAIGRAYNDSLGFVGFNNFNAELFNNINWANENYDSFLVHACKFENFIHTINNSFFRVKNLEDFKNLYKELSKKESLNYCSQELHEKFTNLFIEYKELLK